jgi:hypothetical protein
MKLPASPKSCGYLIVFGLLLAIALLSLEGCTAVVTKTGSDKTHGLKFVEKCTAELLTAFGPNGPDPYGPSLFDCVTFTMQIDDPAPPGPNPPYSAVLIRQPDCSITRLVLDGNLNIEPSSTIPNYESLLHNAVKSSTTANQFKGGCKDTTIGIASQVAVGLGQLANGNANYAVISADGLASEIDSPVGHLVSAVDYPAFTPSSNPSATAFSIATADLNGDGKSDLVLASFGFSGANPGLISVYLGNGDGTFQAASNIPVAVPATGVIIDDVNKDGKLDLVVIGQTLFSGAPGLEVLPGNGDGTFGSPIVSSAQNLEALVGVTGDFNGDGNKDLALNSGQIFLGDGAGNFTLQPNVLSTLTTGTIGGNPNFVTGIAAGDFNHDGKIDLAVTNAVSATVDMYFGKGDGTFTYQGSYASLYGQQNIQTTDLDGDGNSDLFVGTASGGGFGADLNSQGFFLSLLNLGNGQLAAPPAYLPTQPALQFPVLYDVADFNGDSKPDIVTVGADAGNTTALLSVLENNGSGSFTQGPQTNINVPGLAASQAKLQALAAADLDGDGKMDVVFAHTDQGGANVLSVSLGNGDGTFKTQTDFSISGSVVGLVVADLNGDNKPDLAFIQNPATDGTSTGTGIFVMLNTSTGAGSAAFHAPQQIDLQPNLAFLNVHDLGNGKQDLVATSGNIATTSTGNSVFVYLGNGDGSFKPATKLSGGTFPGPVGVGDMNNDGKLDLVVAATNSDDTTGTLTFFPGNGDGTFQPGQVTQISEGNGSSLVIANPSKSGNQSVFLGTCCGLTYTFVAGGNGDGTFAASGNGTGVLPLGISSQQLKLVDVNGDGFLDTLLVSNQYAIEVFLNQAPTLPKLTSTTETLTASAASVTAGQSVSFTAQLAPFSGAGIPTGSVTFVDGGQNLATTTLDATGKAVFTSASLVVGTHSIVGFYNGDATHGLNTSTATVAVDSTNLIATTTTLSGPSSAATGASVTFTATVAPSSGAAVPTGTVTFLDGTTSLGTGTLSASGAATLTTTTLAAGSHSITAQYGGDTSFAASTSTALSIAIGGGSGSFTLLASPAALSLMAGQSGTVTLTATPSAGITSITYACSGLPSKASCTVGSSATSSDGTIMTMLTVATTAASGVVPTLPAPRPYLPLRLFVWFATATLLALLTRLVRQAPRRHRWAGIAAMLVVLPIGVAAGCGGGSSSSPGGGGTIPGTPAGTSTITVTGTAGSGATAVKQTTTIQLTVQ